MTLARVMPARQYLPDEVHTSGKSWQRADLTEGSETRSGGNGATGNDETSENLSATFREASPSPNRTMDPTDHLVVSEFAVTPTAGEFIEIHNPTTAAVSLTDVYLTDATFAGGSTYYYQIVTGGGGGGGFGDFHARFPNGARSWGSPQRIDTVRPRLGLASAPHGHLFVTVVQSDLAAHADRR